MTNDVPTLMDFALQRAVARMVIMCTVLVLERTIWNVAYLRPTAHGNKVSSLPLVLPQSKFISTHL